MANTLTHVPQGMTITADIKPGYETILTPEALELVATLHRAFEPRRQALLKARAERTKRLDAGERPDFLSETQSIRDARLDHRAVAQRRCNAAASKSPGRSNAR
jgi:malate synthase